VLVSAYIASTGVDPAGVVPGSRTVSLLVIVFGAGLSLWIVRGGAEVHFTYAPEPERLVVRSGRHEREVAFMDVTAVRFDAPLQTFRRWIPTVVLLDRFEIAWRIPAFIDDGEELLEEVLRRVDRDEVRMWVEARGVGRSMRRAGWMVPVGYVVAGVAVVWSIGYTFLP
jgi:hypothetical protein